MGKTTVRALIGLFLWSFSLSAAAAESGADLTEITTWELIRKGGWLMIPIGLCSLLALAYAAERLINLRAGKIMPPLLAKGLENRLKNKDYDGAMALCRETDCVFSRMIRAGLREIRGNWERVEKAIEETGLREIASMRQNIRPLRIVSEIAPLLGLLGTIQGMMGAFQKVSTIGVGKKTEAFAGDIFLALVTTAAGLTVAIPALFLYYYFAGRIDKIVLTMDNATADLLHSARSNDEAGGADAMPTGGDGSKPNAKSDAAKTGAKQA